MSEAFLAAAALLPLQAGNPAAGMYAAGTLAAGALQSLLRQSGVPARRVQEIHWLASGADDGGWLLPTARQLGFAPDLAAFTWPGAPLLEHTLLHAAACSIQSGQRELIVVGQHSGPPHQPQAAAVLLASTAAAGRHNLAPRARLAALLALSAAPNGLLSAASAALKRLAERERAARSPLPVSTPQPARRPEVGQPFLNILPEMLPGGDLRTGLPGQAADSEDQPPERFELPLPQEIGWLAGQVQESSDLSTSFPHARWLSEKPPASQALALFNGLVATLESHSERWGVLISSGPLENGLATLIERV